MILGVIACVAAACSLGLWFWSFTTSSDNAKKSELGPLLSKYAEELSSDYAKRLRAIEVEWDNMYDKFSKLAGRLDRRRALEAPPPSPPDATPIELTRSEILRRHLRK